jgi:hypothetical protein
MKSVIKCLFMLGISVFPLYSAVASSCTFNIYNETGLHISRLSLYTGKTYASLISLEAGFSRSALGQAATRCGGIWQGIVEVGSTIYTIAGPISPECTAVDTTRQTVDVTFTPHRGMLISNPDNHDQHASQCLIKVIGPTDGAWKE